MRCDECPQHPMPGFGRVHAADCFTTVVLPGDPTEPHAWAQQVLGTPPGWVLGLLRLRDAVVRPLGLRTPKGTRPETGFPVLADHGDELLLGLDDRHLDFRVRLVVRDRRVHVSTTVHINNRLGWLYWAFVRHLHPRVVRSMLGSMSFPEVVSPTGVRRS